MNPKKTDNHSVFERVMILQNAIRIREKGQPTVFLPSLDRHHFNHHVFSNGAWVAVDGGCYYLRRSNSNQPPPKGCKVDDFSLNSYDHPLKIIARLLWGTLGKSGKGPLVYKPLSSFSKAHLRAILKNCAVGATVERVIRSLLKRKTKKAA